MTPKHYEQVANMLMYSGKLQL